MAEGRQGMTTSATAMAEGLESMFNGNPFGAVASLFRDW
jgi:hypothetical protein